MTVTINGTGPAIFDTSGNVGIGTSSPSANLDVASTSTTAYSATAYNGAAARMTLRGGNATNAFNATRFTNGVNGEALFGTVQDATGYQAFVWQSYNGAYAERMRITYDGKLFLNTTTNLPSGTSARFQVAYVKAGEWAITVRPTDADGGGGGPLDVCNTAGTSIGTITAGSSSISFNTTSDYRLKENVAPMTGGLTAVKALNPVTYKWELDGSDGEGFIAHELQEVVPLAVIGTKDAVDDKGKPIYQGVDYSKIVVHLVAAIQELKAEFDAYKASHP